MPRYVEITDFGTAAREAARMAGMTRASMNLRPALEEIAADMLRIEEIVFSSGGRRGGGSWARLKENTVVKKGNTSILTTTGSLVGYKKLSGDDILRKSLTEVDAPYQVLKIFKTSIHFGTSRPWAYVHQHGSAKKRIPRRKFMHFTVQDHQRWNRMIARHVVRPHTIK